MDYAEFLMGFWHPFGPHGKEAPDQILDRKQREIEANGWTLWSFQYRLPLTLDAWRRELLAPDCPAVFVYCSRSRAAVDPASSGRSVETISCRSYRLIGQDQWQPLPDRVMVTHPFRKGRTQASAFVVQQIIHPVAPFVMRPVEWFSRGKWRKDRVPTRGEYLIRRGGNNPLRSVCAVLELKAPYLAVVRAEDSAYECTGGLVPITAESGGHIDNG
jgi:hypothetical protein